MKTSTYLLALMLLSVALASCGKKFDSSAIEETNTFQVIENQKLSDFTKRLQLDSSTPSGLATLLGLKKTDNATEIEACTSFLIDKNTLLTNSHCIPQSIKDFPSQDCGEVLQMVVKTDTDVVRTTCQKVIFYSSISSNVTKDNDYALVKIADDILLTRYFNLDRSGFNENEKITAWTLNHSLENGVISSRFIENQCLIKSSYTFGTINSQSSSPVVGFKEQQTNDVCKIVHGNSGSPVITNNYSVAGIIHGGYFPKETAFKNSDSNVRGVSSNLGLITNFRCQSFKYEALDRDLPSTCAQENHSNASDSKKIELLINNKMQEFVNLTLRDLPKIVTYDVKTDSAGKSKVLISFIPKCVLPLESWSQLDLAKIQKSFGRKSYQLETSSNILTISTDFDYYGNVNLNLSPRVITLNLFKLSNLQKLSSNQTAKIISILNNGRELESEISTCSH